MLHSNTSQIQRDYKQRKHQDGWKRVQLWKLDENNALIRKRVKLGAMLANGSKEEAALVEEISLYSNDMLQDIPL